MLTDKLNDEDKEYRKLINNFGEDTIMMVENTSKVFGSTVDQVANSTDYSIDVENNITNLSELVKKLDPSSIDFNDKKFIFFNSKRRYLKKVKSKESIINKLIEKLKKEEEILKRDNITLELEIKNLESIINQIEVECENGLKLKSKIDCNLSEMHDNDRENSYMQNVLGPLEKKLYDLKQMAVIKRQSISALEIICRNNKEIIRNLNTLQNVTVEALNTAIVIANSLDNQKVILNKTEESKVFDNFYRVVNQTEIQNKVKIPEIESSIVELKNTNDV